MRKVIEQRPVATKVLRENFRRGLERNMNKLMMEGYVPVGGISTHMNTTTRPVLGMDSQEYTQTMIKYADFEVWIKETDEERAAYSDESVAESLNSQAQAIKKGAARDLKLIKKLEDALSRSVEEDSPVKRPLFKRIKHAVDSVIRKDRLSRLEATKVTLATRKSGFNEINKELAIINERLAKFYKSNPTITSDALKKSR